METISEDAGLRETGGLKAILYGGALAGVLDMTAACVNGWLRGGRNPVWIFQSVAGGLYGTETFDGGWRTAVLGLIIHFFIATSAAAVFYAASRRQRFLVNQPILSGVLYGVGVWLLMYLIVLPLTPLKMSYTFSSVLTGILIHIFCVGLPIALVVRRFSK
jgi:hypothetical protein